MFDLDAYLAERRAWVDEALERALPPAERSPVRLNEAMRHAVLLGGKRVRPILCLAAAEAAGGDWRDARGAAAAVEILHAYTLVHDDLPCMDNDLVRRGQPTVHARWGETVAVLAGDALQALAFEVLAADPGPRPAALPRLVRELAQAAGAAGVVAGQVEDLAHAGTGDAALVAFVHQHKTADLFRAAMRMGALSAGASEELVGRLGECANHMGLAFQIVDDLLDAPAPGTEARPELTCLSVWTREEARQAAAGHTRQAVDLLRGCPGPTEAIAALAAKMLGR